MSVAETGSPTQSGSRAGSHHGAHKKLPVALRQAITPRGTSKRQGRATASLGGPRADGNYGRLMKRGMHVPWAVAALVPRVVPVGRVL